MKILIDGKPFAAPIQSGSLAHVLEVAGRMVYGNHRGITRILLDGAPMSFETPDEAALSRPAGDYGTIEIETDPILTMLRRDFDQMETVLTNLPAMCHLLAQAFHDVSSDEGYEHFDTLQAAWSDLEDRHITAADVLGTTLSAISFMDATARDHRNAVGTKLNEVAAALEKDDRVAASDLLEYELAELAEAETELSALLYRMISELEESEKPA